MIVPETKTPSNDVVAPGYSAYAQLVRMLLPSSGSLAIYAVDGNLAWCSDGFEKPDFRVLVEDIRKRNTGPGSPAGPDANQGTICKTAGGASVLMARLGDDAGATLGFVVIELGSAHSGAASSIAASLTRPLLSCLAAQLALERPAAVGSAPPPPAFDPRMEFLLGIGEIDLNSPRAIPLLLQRCVDRLQCISAVFCIPDYDLTEVAEAAGTAGAAAREHLDRTRKHLLAWIQLNNRPMVVNRIDADKAPFKILSCPATGRDGKANGLLALFRNAEGANFELDDVRLIEFLSRQAMALLYERQDAPTGLMSRTAFERYLDEMNGGDPARPEGCLLCCDVDQLKTINDAFGFVTGDEVILRTAQLISRSLLPVETACRLTGDRFVIHLPERDAEGAHALGSEIAQSARDLGYTAGGQRVPLALRFGVAEPAAAQMGARHWIAVAEHACQQARARREPNPYNAQVNNRDCMARPERK